MNLFDLKGEAAVVAGGNGGLGLGMAEDIASPGASIVISGRSLEKAKTALVGPRNHRVKAEFIAADVSKKAACQALVASPASDVLTGSAVTVDDGHSSM